jgi:hypothetical protein
LGDGGVDEKIMLEYILKEYAGKICNRLNWLTIGKLIFVNTTNKFGMPKFWENSALVELFIFSSRTVLH